jgi:hypothetical protein
MKQFKDIRLLSLGHTIQMVGAIYSEEGRDYLFYFPGEDTEQPVKEVLEMGPDDWEALIKQTDFLEIEVLVGEENGTVGKAILRKGQRSVEQAISWRVYKRDQYNCRYCGRDDVPLTVDHLVTWESGGPSTEDNLVAACRKCNRTRGEMPYAEWLESPHYKKVSKNLINIRRHQNDELVATLDKIPRRLHQRSR